MNQILLVSFSCLEVKAAHHCDSIGGQQLLRRHGGEVGDVGQGVDQGHQWDGNVDGTRKVPRGGGGGGGTRHLCKSCTNRNLSWTSVASDVA